MKSKIEAYFKNDRSYRTGVKLIMEFSPNISIKKVLNVQPESPYLRGIVFEELRRLAGIPRQEFDDMLLMPVQPEQVKEPAPETEHEADHAQTTDADPEQEKKARRKK